MDSVFFFVHWPFARNSDSLEPDVARREKPCKRGTMPRRTEGGGGEGDRRTPSSRYPSLFSSPLVRHPPPLPLRPSLSPLSLFLSVSLSCRSAPSRPPPLFLALSVTLPFEVSVLLPTAGAEAVTTIIVSEVTSLKHREEEKEHEGGGEVVGAEREREVEKGPTGLFIEPATNIEQLVSIRPVIAAFTQPLSYPLAK